ncbi:MAG: hypothetical protein ACJ751_22420 [Niastella sp.]|uniref:hypothetical protein n=1 Tax=Niastella sp. TaxID=1869183 RepID=UPI00389B13B5
MKYRIRSVIKEIVRSETNGVYELDFSKISVDYFKGSVKLKAVDLKPVSTYPDKQDYKITISHLYFSLGSWSQLFFHRKLFVDSLQIITPVVTLFQQPATGKNGLTPLQEIYRSLEDISEIFKLRVLEVNNGSIGIYKETNQAPVLISNINFRIENFGEKKNEHSHLRYSDNLTLNIARQHWIFPSGQIIRFANLFFSGKDQAFQVDSCSITMAPDSRGQQTSLFADKLLFRTDELVSVIERNELNIDTLYCKSPVLTVAMPANTKASDTVNDLNESIHQLPGNINIKFINIENGQIHLTSSDGKRSYTGKKTNLKIYRLSIKHNPAPIIRAGSIDLNLNEITFATRDSLYLLTVNEFKLDSNNLVCRNAFLKPSPKAKGYLSGIDLPAFTLVDISLNDLLEKRLKALVAVIDRPKFFFASGVVKKKTNEMGIPVDKFYNTLKHLAQLIDVHWLTIRDGGLDYYSEGSPTPELSMKNIDAEINLVDLLHSASLQATKQSIHEVSIGALHLKKDDLRMELENYFFDGSRELGKLRSLSVISPDIQFNAADLYWERFSWENFVRNKSIHIDTLNIPVLAFSARILPGQSLENKGGLLPVTINKLNIERSVIGLKTVNNAEINATATHISLKGLQTAGKNFSWKSLDARADSIFFRDEHKQIAIQRLNLSTQGESALQNIEYSDVTNRVKIPEIKFQLQLINSHPEQLDIPWLSLYRPEIMISASHAGVRRDSANGGIGFKPFHIGTLNIIDGYFNYQRPDNPVNISGRLNAHILSAGIEKINKEAIVFDKVTLKVDSLALTKRVKNGLIEIRNGSGRVAGYPLTVNFAGDNTHLKNSINSIVITDGRLLYYDSTTISTVSKITGNGKEGTLVFRDVVVKPRKTLETFLKTSVWQKDYLTFHCDSIGFRQVNVLALLNDTALAVRYIYLQNPHLSTFRNKNIAFQHGIEKLMPTRLIAGIEIPVQIDSVQIVGAAVDVHEVSAVTKRKGVVPLGNLNAMLKNIVSRPNERDSLILTMSGRVLDYEIRTFRYAESYHDSLSGFDMHYSVSPMQLSHLTEVTRPLSAFAITRGQSDTLDAKLAGNKYAAFGQMDFYYHNLRVRLLDKEDSLKKTLLLSLKTLLANGLIKSNNQSQARMFFIRDREKFVFNFWVKTLFSGFVTSTGIKRNSKYKKMYYEVGDKYSLPATRIR